MEGEGSFCTLCHRVCYTDGRGARKMLQPRLHLRTKRAARSARARHWKRPPRQQACSISLRCRSWTPMRRSRLIHVVKQQYKHISLFVFTSIRRFQPLYRQRMLRWNNAVKPFVSHECRIVFLLRDMRIEHANAHETGFVKVRLLKHVNTRSSAST